MSAEILLGIDLGTTVLKLCVLDAHNGAVIAQASRRLPIQSFPDGGQELELDSLDRAFHENMEEIRSVLSSDWNRIGGIGLASQAGSSILADRKSGKALTPMILWNDGRSHSYTQQLCDHLPENFWRQYVLNDMPPAGLGRLLWMKEIYPNLFQEDSIHIGAGEYLFFQLTGIWRQDAGNAIQIGSYNAVTQQLFPTLLDRIDVPLSFVAPLRDRHETAPLTSDASKMWRLPEGIPVAGPYFDQEASYLSATEASEHPLQISLGTAWVGNFLLPRNINGVSPTQLIVPSPFDDSRLVVQPLLTGNPTWEWGLRRMAHTDLSEALVVSKEWFSESLLPPRGLTTIPWFSQINFLNSNGFGSGAVVGINDRTTHEDQLRALSVGMVFELARVFDEVRQSGAFDSIVLGGGASKGEHFCQLIAAWFSPIPAYRLSDEDLCAARGSVFALNPRAAQSSLEKIVAPDELFHHELRNLYDDYLKVFQSLYGSVDPGKAYRLNPPIDGER